MAGDDRLDAEDVARRLRVTVETVYRLVNAGELPATRWPLTVSPSDLDEFIRRSRVVPRRWTARPN